MRIVHLCLSCFYIDGYAYQENELVAQHVRDGHDVTVIASTESFDDNRQVTYLQPGRYMGTDGAMVTRLPYRRGMPEFIKRKLRMHPGLYQLLEEAAPDVILFHGLSGWEVLTAAKYKRRHPKTKLFIDSHEDFNNSARNFLSRHVLHSLYYQPILRRCLPSFEKVLCISVDTMKFAEDFYKVPRSLLEFYPLGGQLYSDEEYERTRDETRKAYGIAPDALVFVQSGKMDRKKKLIESLTAFSAFAADNAVYLLVGHILPDIEEEANRLIQADKRVRMLGWKQPEDLRKLLCAADVYVQPGSQSATMQMSICCRCVVILDDVPSHRPFLNDNGWLLNQSLGLQDVFSALQEKVNSIPEMAARSHAVALQLLDYRSLAARLY